MGLLNNDLLKRLRRLKGLSVFFIQPFSPCPLQPEFREVGFQVPEAGWENLGLKHNETKTIVCFADPPIIVPYGNEVECVLE